jgi:mannitol/fructose-specific phosphotransferase system IIA component
MKTIEQNAREFINAIASNMPERNILLSDIANTLTDGEALAYLGATDDHQPMIEHAHAIVVELINSGVKYWKLV